MASDPPPESEPERPPIWTERDGPATAPEPQPEPEPEPEPDPEPEPEPPAVGEIGGGMQFPKVAAERLDRDGDGVPDGPGRDPILADGGGTYAGDGPPRMHAADRQIAEAGADQSSEAIDRPDGADRAAGTVDNLRGGAGNDNLLDDDITAMPIVVSGGTTMGTGDEAPPAGEPHVVEEPIPMQDADRGQLPDGDGERDPGAELTDDITSAPESVRSAPVVQPEPDHAPVEPDPVETDAPAAGFRPEVGDEVIVENVAAPGEAAAPVDPAPEPEIVADVVPEPPLEQELVHDVSPQGEVVFISNDEPEPSIVVDVPEPPIEPDPLISDEEA